MKLDFRIDWGYQYMYSRRHYHPVYIWDGNLTCENGTIEKSFQLEYPYVMFGPGYSAKEIELSKPEWKNRTKRGYSGVRFVADVNENTVFHLNTTSFSTSFAAKDIIEKGRTQFAVGPKYLNCNVTVNKTGFYWYKPAFKEGETIIDGSELGLPVHNWSRMSLAYLEPNKRLKFEVDVKEKQKDYRELLIHLVAMAVPRYTDEGETPVRGDIYYEIFLDGKSVVNTKKYFRFHDRVMQMLEDDWKRIDITTGKHTIEIQNNSAELIMGIDRITTKVCEFNHGQLSVPDWKLREETVTAAVFAAYEDKIDVEFDGQAICVECKKGWNEFKISSKTIGKLDVKTKTDTKQIEIYDIDEEKYPVKVGYDMTVVPHDSNGFMDWLLNYTHRTRLGNYVIFRDFRKRLDTTSTVTYEEKYNWADYLRRNNTYVSACVDYDDGAYIKGAGEMLNECGLHELSLMVYAKDPQEPYASNDMKEATEKFTEYYKKQIDHIHSLGAPAAFGDACGGIRHSIIAGADFVRAETMVGAQTPLLAKTRAATQSLGNGRWGVHIAIHHPIQLYNEAHLGMYFLSLMQPWCMGAELIYEEDSLFQLFKEEREAWDDALTKGKRDMTRSFFKFVKTHPRKGKNIRTIAVLEGRYAAPFNGFICDYEQTPHYSVWGAFGNNDESWGHSQPEKCQQIYDVLMPGASTQPLRQKFDRRRFFFSGSPYGDFDMLPVEASGDFYKNYSLIMNLGWNTCIEEDLQKISEFVKNGGTYLTAIPEFSTHIKRDFLKDMKDLSLYNNGDLSELSGIRVKGVGVEYSGQWNSKNKEQITEPELSAMPSDDVTEDGKAMLCDIELCGAETVAWDSASGKPMLVRYKLGKGYVYTFTIWAYPGHELLQKFTSAWVAKLSNEHKTSTYVSDDSKEVFWTVWQDEDETKVMLLNTDWTKKDNVKDVKLVFGENSVDIAVKERALTVISLKNDTANIEEYSL